MNQQDDFIDVGDTVEVVRGEFKNHIGLVYRIEEYDNSNIPVKYFLRIGTRELSFIENDIKKVIIQ